MTATRFAPVHNIFTGQDVIELVPIPAAPAKGTKGTTLHDDKFDKLAKFDQALKVPEYQFGGMRKALQRYLDNKGLRGTVSMRQKKDHKTKSYTIWLVNEPPQVVIPRKGEKK
jgi:ABC-type branched-subunit amino acid transport system substrate-binding protein